MNGKTMRDVFWDKVYELAWNDKDIIIVSADMGAPALDKFRKDLKSQYVDVGIAEQNAILISAGLALGGKKVFAYAIAPFITYRCYEQIKIVLSAMNIPVTFVGVGAGVSYDDSGPTHHTVEDISILRILPNMTVNSITDNSMASAFAEISCNMTGPNYIRLDRKLLPMIYKENSDFSEGMAVLTESKDVCIAATGNMVHRALEVSEMLEENGINTGVIDIYRFPINEEVLIKSLKGVKRLVTMEEHTLPGGLGSSVCEVLADNNILIPVKRLGMDFRSGYCYKYGGRDNIQKLYKLDKQSVVEAILQFCVKTDGVH